MSKNVLYQTVEFLKELISIPSLSREEGKTGDRIQTYLEEMGVVTHRVLNNVYAVNKSFDSTKPSILLNSHHDTVRANSQYTLDPYLPIEKDGKLYGLGSTDAGASLVSLMAAFLHFYSKENLSYNIIFAATAEEEISGKNGIEKLFSTEGFKNLFSNSKSFAIVGEPTQLELATAEKGLLVVDCIAVGKAGHAARDEGENALYKAMEAIEWVKTFQFEKVSPLLGKVKMSVTSIFTENTAHNIIPSNCNFTIDIRVNELYSHEEILNIIQKQVDVQLVARSTRLRSSFIEDNHPVVVAGLQLGKKIYGSPTLSDKALIPLSTLKCGPGNSSQSHTADEFVEIDQIDEGIKFYVNLLELITQGDKKHFS